jgi:hypothetical protein
VGEKKVMKGVQCASKRVMHRLLDEDLRIPITGLRGFIYEWGHLLPRTHGVDIWQRKATNVFTAFHLVVFCIYTSNSQTVEGYRIPDEIIRVELFEEAKPMVHNIMRICTL